MFLVVLILFLSAIVNFLYDYKIHRSPLVKIERENVISILNYIRNVYCDDGKISISSFETLRIMSVD